MTFLYVLLLVIDIVRRTHAVAITLFFLDVFPLGLLLRFLCGSVAVLEDWFKSLELVAGKVSVLYCDIASNVYPYPLFTLMFLAPSFFFSLIDD